MQLFKRVAYFNKDANVSLVLSSNNKGQGVIGGCLVFNQFRTSTELDINALFQNSHDTERLEQCIQDSLLCSWYQQGDTHSKFYLQVHTEDDRRLLKLLVYMLMQEHGMVLFRSE